MSTCQYCEAAEATVFVVCAGDPASDYSGPSCDECASDLPDPDDYIESL